ncbi:hypothetical protein Ahy_B08g091120 isoform B [Arachis hypogaea]|uniref:Uncharacterized protein n=1 Tax=Arachis hypogaea TaxID=3818 RepID=A0A444Y1K3_ARAHY|nr:hypothetical protein Ahy_B08g091120 isoform B [Arachis hypogaea]
MLLVTNSVAKVAVTKSVAKALSSHSVPLAASLRLRQSGERSPFRRVLVGGVLVGAILVGAISSPRVFIAVCPSPRTSSACSAIVTDHRIPVQICCCSPRVILFSASPPVVTSSPISTTTTIVFQFSVKQCETYKADLNIDLKKHHAPVTFLDKMAYWIVKSLRFSTIYSFSRKEERPCCVPDSVPCDRIFACFLKLPFVLLEEIKITQSKIKNLARI